MKNVSMAHRLGSSREEAKDNQEFGTANEVGYFFQKLLRVAGQELENPTSASSEALKSFLESINKNNRASLKGFLKNSSLSTGPESVYTEFKRRYEPMDVNQVLYIIDEEFLVKEARIVTTPDRPRTSAERIRIIMSTILWMDNLFPSCEGMVWKMRFISFPIVSLKESLDWLRKVRQHGFLTGHQLSDHDKNILNKLWNWFDTHDQRPVKLAFAMASHGMVRDVLNERGQLSHIIDDLNKLIGMPVRLGIQA
jgi:hypothetical protein